MTEVGGFTFLAQDDPADWAPGGAAQQRSATLLQEVGAQISGSSPRFTAEPRSTQQRLIEARRWAAQQVAKDAAKRMEQLAESLERLLPTMSGVERERCEAAASAYRESARIVREEGGSTDV